MKYLGREICRKVSKCVRLHISDEVIRANNSPNETYVERWFLLMPENPLALMPVTDIDFLQCMIEGKGPRVTCSSLGCR